MTTIPPDAPKTPEEPMTSASSWPDLASAGADPMSPKRVLLIGGMGRSGSTLIESILGQVPGCVNIGELVHLWIRGLSEDELTGDGTPFRESEVWNRIADRAFGGWDQLDLDDVRALQLAVDRQRYVPFMLNPSLKPGFEADMRRYVDLLARLYTAIREVHGAKVIVDASKHSSHAFLLRHTPGIELRIVHLVRDPRGVAYSWTKKVKKPEVVGEDAFMHTYHPGRMAGRWMTTNAQFHALKRLGVPTLGLRYEDFVADPRGEIETILDFAGHHPKELPFVGEREVMLAPTPTIAGNPMRFKDAAGPTTIRADVAWMERFPEKDRRLVGALTWPQRVRYGYPTDPSGGLRPRKDTR